MELNYKQGNEELLEELYSFISQIEHKEKIVKYLDDKARWGSMYIVFVQNSQGKTQQVGIATIDNGNMGYVEYFFVKQGDVETQLVEKLVAWLKWFKVKSITNSPEKIVVG